MQYGTGKGPTWFLGTATQGDYICDWVDGSRWIGKWKLREVHGQYLLHVTECKDGAECKNTWTIHLQPNTLQGIIDNDPKCPFNLQR